MSNPDPKSGLAALAEYFATVPVTGSESIPVQLPAAIAEFFRERYAEYIKPELFFKWLFEQEQIKLNVTKQQLEFELQQQYNLARVECDRWNSEQFIKRDEQLHRELDNHDPK